MERTANYPIYTTIGTIIALLFFAITFAVKFTSLKEKLEYRITNMEEKNIEQENALVKLNDKINQSDVAFAEIKIRLTNIETLLLELKQQIKNK